MHYTTILLALFASAVVAKEPWAISFKDSGCNDSPSDDSVTVGNGCIPVNFKEDHVKFNFGSGLDEIEAFGIYSDAKCKTVAGDNINSTSEGTPARCISRKDHAKAWGTAAWGSIQWIEL